MLVKSCWNDNVLNTASWEQNHPKPIWWKNYTNSLGWIFIYLWVVRVCGFNIGIGFPSYLKDISWFVQPKMRLYKVAIFWPKKWLFCNSDTTFTLTKFSRLHFVQYPETIGALQIGQNQGLLNLGTEILLEICSFVY